MIPKNVELLIKKEIASHQKNQNFFHLRPRRDKEQDTFAFTPLQASAMPGQAAPKENSKNEETAKSLLLTWHDFHKAINYIDFQHFYSKLLFCTDIKPSKLNPTQFLELIADRSFLFLEQSDNYAPPGFLTLADYVNNNDPSSWAKNSTSTTDAANKQLVMQQGFIPTYRHHSVFNEWQTNLAALNEALKTREEAIKNCPPLPTFSITFSKAQETSPSSCTELCTLFESYLRALEKYAYEKYFTDASAESKPYLSIVSQVYSALKNNEMTPTDKSLIFFHLFARETKRLYTGTLKTYRFKSLTARKNSAESPPGRHSRIRQRIRCNIILFDYLLKHFAPTDDNSVLSTYYPRSKYLFYLYTRYDRYCHFALPPQTTVSYSFELQEDLNDGVDHFGNLLRTNINACIPCSLQWLTPKLSVDPKETSANTVATYLLMEGVYELPASERAVSLALSFLRSEEGDWFLSRYNEHRLNPTEKKLLLDEANKQLRKDAAWNQSASYEIPASKRVKRYIWQDVLEFAIHISLAQNAIKNLHQIATELFQSQRISEYNYQPEKHLRLTKPASDKQTISKAEYETLAKRITKLESLIEKQDSEIQMLKEALKL